MPRCTAGEREAHSAAGRSQGCCQVGTGGSGTAQGTAQGGLLVSNLGKGNWGVGWVARRAGGFVGLCGGAGAWANVLAACIRVLPAAHASSSLSYPKRIGQAMCKGCD